MRGRILERIRPASRGLSGRRISSAPIPLANLAQRLRNARARSQAGTAGEPARWAGSLPVRREASDRQQAVRRRAARALAAGDPSAH